MAQVTNYTIEDGDGLTVLADLTATFAAVRDDNAGPTAPPNPVPGMRWRDTSASPPVLRIRNVANSGWETLLTMLGATTVGSNVFTAANEAAARGAIGAPPTPTSSSSEGQWRLVESSVGGALTLPSGGTWAYFWTAINQSSGIYVNAGAGIAAGGTSVASAVANTIYRGFAWRTN